MQPSIGRAVHYTSYGTPGGEYPKTCRAAIITAVDSDDVVSLFVMNPEGIFLNQAVTYDGGAEPSGGTWHWPERVG